MIDNDRVNNSQLSIFIILTVVGVGIFSLPRLVAESANEDGWIATIVGGCIALANFYVVSRLVNRFPDDTLVEMAEKTLGRFIGVLMLAIFWLYALSISSMTLRIFGEVIKMSILLRTPIEVIDISLLILILWLARGGIEPIVRFDEVVFPIIMFTLAFILAFAIPRSDFSNILPTMRSGILRLLDGAYKSTYSYAGYEFILLIVPFIKKPGKVFKSGAIALAVIGALYVLTVILSFAKFGVLDTKKLIWPTLTLIRSIEVPGSFVERLEGIVMTQWILLAYTTIVPLAFCLSLVPSRLLKHREFKHFCPAVIPVIYVLSLMPSNIVEAYKYLDFITNYLEAPAVFLLPVMLLIVSSIRKVGISKNG